MPHHQFHYIFTIGWQGEEDTDNRLEKIWSLMYSNYTLYEFKSLLEHSFTWNRKIPSQQVL